MAGANANNGANVGRFYGNWRNSAGNSRWNYAVLHFFPSVPERRRWSALRHRACHSLAPWQKYDRTGRGLVGRANGARVERPHR